MSGTSDKKSRIPEENLSLTGRELPTMVTASGGERSDAEQTQIDTEQLMKSGLKLPLDFGDYRLLTEVARGGMGIVYKAEQKSLGRIVALKMIRPEMLQNATDIKRFYQEAQTSAGMDHPNIVPIYEIRELNGQYYFTMAFIDGTTLKGHPNRGRHSRKEVLDLFIPVVDAVAFAHQRGVIHRDLKPDNVLIDLEGRPRVTDFGLAKRLEGNAELTHAGQIVGTPAYMAPEQALSGKQPVGPPADVYGLGGILYFLLTGRAPFSGDSLTEVLVNVVNSPPRAPHLVSTPLCDDLERICLRCLEKKPEKRPHSADELLRELRALAGSSASMSAATAVAQSHSQETVTLPTARLAPAGSSRPAWLVPAGAAVLLTVALGTLVLVFSRGRPALPPENPQVVPNSTANAPSNPPPTNDNPTRAVQPEISLVTTPSAAANSAAVPPATADPALEALLQPVIKTNDIDLRVTVLGAKLGVDNVRSVKAGESVSLEIAVDRDAYLGIWSIGPDGSVVQIFPNDEEPDNLVLAGHPRRIPGKDYRFEAEVSTGIEYLRVIASTDRWQVATGGDRAGPFRTFDAGQGQGDFRELMHGIATRGLAVKKGAAPTAFHAAESLIQYKVVPE